MGDTKTQILDAAESLFAEHGIEAVHLRRIIAEAGVNQAAIHYHFGSKEALVKAVFARRFDPVNRERVALLDEVKGRSEGSPPRVEEILHAVVGPAIRMGQGSEEGARFRCLAGRLLTERPGYLGDIFEELFAEVERRFDALLQLALPNLTERERAWRKFMAIGAMGFILKEQDWIREATGGLCDTRDADATAQRLVQFMAAGLEAAVLDSLGEESGAEETAGAVAVSERKAT